MEMKEIYEYMNNIIKNYYKCGGSGMQTVEIDTEQFFKLFHMVCYMMQIRNIVNQGENE
jgi:hypothetical protein